MLKQYNRKGQKDKFGGKHHCYNLIYYERFDNPEDAISREKEMKNEEVQKGSVNQKAS